MGDSDVILSSTIFTAAMLEIYFAALPTTFQALVSRRRPQRRSQLPVTSLYIENLKFKWNWFI